MAIKHLHSSYLQKQINPDIVRKLIFKDVCERNVSLNAFITLLEQRSESDAKESCKRYESKKHFSCLDGIPIVVKDNFCVEGERTTCGSKMLMNFKPTYTATAVNNLLRKGAILIGKTNMDEFAMGSASKDSAFGEMENPWRNSSNEICITGGSSGGTAVAVAAGWALAGLGTDTGGSIRLPAALTGLVGFKPSYGLISRHGVISLMNSLDTVSIISRTVDDAKLVFDGLIGKDERDLTTWTGQQTKEEPNFDIRKIRIGIPKEMHPEGLEPDILEIWEQTAEMLASKGCEIVKVSLPHTKLAGKCYSVLCCVEVASNMARYSGVTFGNSGKDHGIGFDTMSKEMAPFTFDKFVAKNRCEGLGASVRERILMGNFFMLRKHRHEYLEQAQKIWRLICSDFDSVLRTSSRYHIDMKDDNSVDKYKVDALLTPAALETAPSVQHFTSNSTAADSSGIFTDNRIAMIKGDLCTQPSSLAGLPAIVLPTALSQERAMPIGLQLIAARDQEALLFYLASHVEKWAAFEHRFSFVYEAALHEATFVASQLSKSSKDK